MNEETKPCPFCGDTENTNFHYPDEYGQYVFWCGNCGAFGPTDVNETKARKMWNLRRPTDALLAACEAARQFIQNGIEFGYIYVPDDDIDPASDTLPMLDAAIARARGEEVAE